MECQKPPYISSTHSQRNIFSLSSMGCMCILITSKLVQTLLLQHLIRLEQATIQGFEAKGFSTGESEALLRKSVEIAFDARDIYYDRCENRSYEAVGDDKVLRHRPILVAASVGSYGAYLADGSEYSGIYGDEITLESLKDFHRRRVQILAESGADLIAFETIPNKLEAQAYAELLEEESITVPAWFAFNSKDGVNVVSGDSLVECVSIAESCKKVVAVGINCTPPRFIHGLILAVKKVTAKPILIYPNSGERYDPDQKEWVVNTGVLDEDFVSYVGKWCDDGASLVGGCCRTTPHTIRAIYRTLSSRKPTQFQP
ncbi:homocysteine S-methyltransferase 2-like isoform X2 [Carica papaya]|uniref:homocysteine S-methyltransferase 2-like isoform X2 n=1 Tax=Carica papaya TaxID=3649 RepID=UPI000B8CA4E3|nr:homocysteine S-methyltransferase 2-like isoform X2 [Carica papaya]